MEQHVPTHSLSFTDPCFGMSEGDKLPRYDPERAGDYDDEMCTGYFECIKVHGTVAADDDHLVPVAKCCGM